MITPHTAIAPNTEEGPPTSTFFFPGEKLEMVETLNGPRGLTSKTDNTVLFTDSRYIVLNSMICTFLIFVDEPAVISTLMTITIIFSSARSKMDKITSPNGKDCHIVS